MKTLRWVVPALLLLVMALAIPYSRNLLLWLDQGANTALGGDPRETVSSTCGKVRAGHYRAPVHRYALCWWVCPLLNVTDAGHCDAAIDPAVGEKRTTR